MNHFEPTQEQIDGYAEWIAQRPECIRKVVDDLKLTPWKLYKLKTTGQRVTVGAFSEPEAGGNVTCLVNVLGDFNLVTHERSVFGIDPYDLEECDLPARREPVGNLDLSFDVLKGLITRETGE